MGLGTPEDGNGKEKVSGGEGEGWTLELNLTPHCPTAACREDPLPYFDETGPNLLNARLSKTRENRH